MMSGRWTRVVLSAVIGAAGLGLGGCKTVKQSDYDAAIRENTELRDRIAALQDTVRQANDQTGGIESENQRLAEENQRLRADLAAASTRPTAVTSGGGSSGFENIPGVSVSRNGAGIAVAVAGDVLFDSGSATLKSSSRASLDRVVSVIRSRYSGMDIRVEGYTDSDPIRRSKWRSNEQLSAERALAVEEYLVKAGIANDRVHVAAFGPSNPKGSKKESRRVEIVILGS